MSRLAKIAAVGVVAAATLVAGTPAVAFAVQPPAERMHLVVIYEENHSFDNLYGGWGAVGGRSVDGPGRAARAPQVDQSGRPIGCLFQNDANLATTTATVKWLDGSSHPGLLSPACGGHLPNGGAAFDSHFTASGAFAIQDFVKPADATCAPPTAFAANGVERGDPQGLPGGCTRDLVHRFYQEQYQFNDGRMNRYVTGSDAGGLTMGFYDTRQLPIYGYLHSRGAPHYVLADHFFQGAFGGSFLNHQYLIAAQAPVWAGAPTAKHSTLDAAGFPNGTYPLYAPQAGVTYTDGPLTQACGATAIATVACGDFAVNTVQPASQPSGGGSNVLPLINDTDPAAPNYEANIGDRLSAKGVSWAWYSGGWNAANAGTPDPLFQFHHQPFNYFANYAPGASGRGHLKDEQDFLASVTAGTLPSVSFVKPVGEENEHPGYASTDAGEQHLVDLVKAIETGPQARNTVIVVTYDEFGGQWDHVAPPGQGPHATPGPHDAFGPGTRIPALVIGRPLRQSTVDSTPYDTTSIAATIERLYGLAPMDTRNHRDAAVNDLRHALLVAGPCRW